MARKIEIEIVGSTKDLEAALDRAQKKTGGFSQGISKATLPAAAALAALGVGAKKTIDAASDLGESVNAVNVVFGKSADKILAFSKIAAGEAGLSMRAFNELVTPVGAALQNTGLSADQAADASIRLAKRAADMASVFNVDVKDALGAIQAGLRGEADPLERFGVGLSAAAVQSHALTMGLAGTAAELTANDKAQARLSLLMKQTDKVAGDFTNTSDQLANTQRINAAEAENTSAKIGKGLLPVMQTFQGVLKTVTTIMSENIGATKIVAAVVGGLAVGILAVSVGMKAYAVAQTLATAATWLFNAALAANPLVLVVIGLVALGAALVVAYKKSETFRDIVNGAFGAVKKVAETFVDFFTEDLPGAFNKVLNWVKSNWPEIATIISGPFAPIVLLATDAFGIRSAIVGAFVATKNWVKEHWPEIATIISGPFAPLVLLATGAFGVRGALETAFGAIKTFVGNRIDDVAGFITGLPGKIGDFGAKLLSTFTGFFGGAGIGGWVGNRVSEWAGFVADIPGKIADFGASLLNKVMGIINGAGIGSAIVERIGGWADFFGELPGKAASAISGAAHKVLSAVTGIFSSLPGFVKKILGISSPSKVFADIGEDIVGGIVKGLQSKAGDLRDAAMDMAKSIAGDAWDTLSGVGKKIGGAVAGAAGAVGGALGMGGGEGGTGGSMPSGYVTGDVAGLASSFMNQLRQMAGGHGQSLSVQSGYRTYAEQAALVAQKGLWSSRNPTGAAAPGTSKHESGRAADITPGRPSWPFAGNYGLTFPIGAEPWHIESFDKGGWLLPGITVAINKTGKAEPVLAPGAVATAATGSDRELIGLLRQMLAKPRTVDLDMNFTSQPEDPYGYAQRAKLAIGAALG